MVSARHRNWLYEQLPELVEKGVLSANSAESLKRHYGEREDLSSRSVAMVLFSVIGALLVGGGIILLLAHNWQELSRATRTLIALTPLLISQGLAAWILVRRKGVAWRESVSTFWVLSLGSALALIEQTYHIPGDYERFVLRWLLLALPTLWILRSASGLVLYLIGIGAWAPFALQAFDSSLGYWPLLAAVLPMIVWRYKEAPDRPSTALVGWALAASLLVGLPMSFERLLEELWPTLLALVFAGFFLLGKRISSSHQLAIQRPFRLLGALLTVTLCLILSYEDPWRSVTSMPPDLGTLFETGNLSSTVVLVLTIAAIGALLVSLRASLEASDFVFLACPLVLFGASLVPGSIPAVVITNAYLLVLGATCIARGFLSDSLRYNNMGMSIVAALTLLRFFDSDLDMVVRGIAFILVGVGFFLTNWNLVRRRRSTP